MAKGKRPQLRDILIAATVFRGESMMAEDESKRFLNHQRSGKDLDEENRVRMEALLRELENLLRSGHRLKNLLQRYLNA